MAEEFEAGWIGGLAQVMLGHPLDTIKVRLQAHDPTGHGYRGTFHCISSIIRHESMLGMFKGMLSPLLSITAINALAFGVRGNVLKYYDNPTLFDHWKAGALGGVAQLLISSPFELVKIRMQMSGVRKETNFRRYNGFLKTLTDIHKQEGITGCYRGLVITGMRDIPAFGIYFSCYEASRCELVRRDTPALLTEILAGGTGGVASWVLTYAVDSIKSRVQADGARGVVRYKGLADAIYQSLKNESFLELHKGIGVTVVRAFFVNAFIFTAYAYSRKFIVDGRN